MTYSRRYALSALVGIVTEEDDDGALASPRTGGTEGGYGAKKNNAYAQPAPEMPLYPEAQAVFAQSRTGACEGSPLLAGMPRLGGISYSLTTAHDGKICIAASGDTGGKKQILSQAGFRYNPQRKIWRRYAGAA